MPQPSFAPYSRDFATCGAYSDASGRSSCHTRRERLPRGATRAYTASSRELAAWLAKDGQLLMPLVELLEKGERTIDEVIDVMGRATVEAVLQMSAEEVAGPKAQGRRGPDREVGPPR